MDKAAADFSGYVTKAGLRCSDGRTIMPEAFAHMDGKEVPLVWQHGHDKPENVLGKIFLEHRDDGVYGYAFLNNTDQAKVARELVQHQDIKSFSIYANGLVEKAKQVFHGVIREASLVLSGANPGALIDYIAIRHADDSIETLEDEAIIYSGEVLKHSEEGQNGSESEVQHADEDSLQKIYDSLNEEQTKLLHYMLGEAVAKAKESSATHSSTDDDQTTPDEEGTGEMKHNVFEDKDNQKEGEQGHVLTHDAMKGIVDNAKELGSLKQAVDIYALQHGIENIDILFPDAKTIGERPEWVSRDMEWVAGVMAGTRKTPFSRIRTRSADITHEEARAKGYIKGNLKKEEFFGLSQRTTGPTTVYKKQKLDRDDIIDITDFDVVVWMKAEMRVMLNEELARAVLIGDGREVDDPDKVRDPMGAPEGTGIRSILHDHELFVTTVTTDLDDTNPDYNVLAEDILLNQQFYKGSGTPTLYTTYPTMVKMLLSKDLQGRRRWNTKAELASALLVKDIVTVEVMETADPEATDPLLGIIVNLYDYVMGADKGGEVNLFDDFDIDYNQYKYLIETRCSGALVKLKSALVLRRAAVGSSVIVPLVPEFDGSEITIPTQAGTTYSVDGVVQVDGATVAVAPGETAIVTAAPDAGKHFANNANDEWIFEAPPA